MVPLKVGGRELNVKSEWEDISLSEYMQLEGCKDPDELWLFSFITGIPKEDLMNIDEQSFNEEWLQHISFLAVNAELLAREIPEVLSINGHPIVVPKKLEQLTWFQSRKVKQLIGKVADDSGKVAKEKLSGLFRDCCIIYLQPLLNHDAPPDKKVDDKKYDEVEKIILSLPVTQVYPMGAFFLSKWVSFY